MSMKKFKLAKLTARSMGYKNSVYVNPEDLQKLGLSEGDSILISEQQVSQILADPKLNIGELGTSGLVWKALHLNPKEAVGTVVTVQPWNGSKLNTKTPARTVSIVVDTYVKSETAIKMEELEEYILETYNNRTICKDQRFVIKWVQYNQNYWLNLYIAAIYKSRNDDEEKNNDDDNKAKRRKTKKQQDVKFAVITKNTSLSLLASQNPYMKLIVPKGRANVGMKFGPQWDAEQMGIGGLDSQFTIIFRRAFASRLFPPDIVNQLGIKHVKGMLLYGPPGTGKTLIARSIGSMLTDNEPKVVNGPEILNKYVGQSEENIRALFAEAIEEQKEKGDESSLHIIIFDEIDAICKQRGSSSAGGSGVHDTVVNQILSMIDGVNALNNVLVIGMTNRKDLLDDALLRSGRLEVKIEIGLPDEDGREQIFRIHTKSLRDHGYLDEDVSIADLAKRTKNYTGAEIAGVVRSAVSYAMQTHVDVENIGKMDVKKLRNIRISKEYFELALEEVLPELGRKSQDDKLSFSYQKGIYLFNKQIEELINLCKNIINKMTSSVMLNRQALLIRGNMGSGKTAISSYIANDVAQWPFIRLISADNFVGSADITICNAINKAFNDSYKSALSIIILDDVERLIGYTIGPRFSNSILQAILTCVRRTNQEDQDRKVFVIATCTHNVSRDLSLNTHFDFVRNMPTIKSKKEFENVLNQSGSHKKCKPNAQSISDIYPSTSKGVGIADLLTVLELSINEDDTITSDSFLNAWKSKFTSYSSFDNDDDLNLDIGFDDKI